MHHSSSNPSYNVTFANNFTGCGKLGSLKHWFGEIWRGDLILSSVLSQSYQEMAYS